tara:strand:- start:597 stop:755 length:159 start_codon:yes stop_codon:yes gene_type:complete
MKINPGFNQIFRNFVQKKTHKKKHGLNTELNTKKARKKHGLIFLYFLFAQNF